MDWKLIIYSFIMDRWWRDDGYKACFMKENEVGKVEVIQKMVEIINK